jgi:hypothetical protein
MKFTDTFPQIRGGLQTRDCAGVGTRRPNSPVGQFFLAALAVAGIDTSSSSARRRLPVEEDFISLGRRCQCAAPELSVQCQIVHGVFCGSPQFFEVGFTPHRIHRQKPLRPAHFHGRVFAVVPDPRYPGRRSSSKFERRCGRVGTACSAPLIGGDWVIRDNSGILLDDVAKFPKRLGVLNVIGNSNAASTRS